MSDLLSRLRIETNARAAAAEVGVFDRALEHTGQSGRTARAGLDQAAAGARNLDSASAGARGSLGALQAGIGALGLRELITGMSGAAQAAGGMTMGLGAVAGGSAGARQEMAFLRAESERLGLVNQEAARSFLSLAGATNGTALAGQETREIFLGVAEASAALGRSNEQAGRGLEAIGQIASKGVVSMEEIRQQLAEAIPGASVIAARAMGMTGAEFSKVVGEGKLLAEDFLPKFAAQLRAEFGPSVDAYITTPLGEAKREISETKTELFDLQAIGGEAFLAGVIQGLTGMNEALDSEATRDAAANLGRQLGELAGVGAQGLGALAENAQLVVTGLEMMVAVQAGRWLSGVATSALQAASAAKAKALATEAAAVATLAEANANRAAISSNLTYAQRLAVVAAAERNLAVARSGGAAATNLLRTAGGGLLAMFGGPWGIALAAAGAGVAFLASESAKSAAEIDNLEARMRASGVQLKAGGGDMASMGSQAAQAIEPIAAMTGEVGKLADETFRLAAARKAADLAYLDSKATELQGIVKDTQKNLRGIATVEQGFILGMGADQGAADFLADMPTGPSPSNQNATRLKSDLAATQRELADVNRQIAEKRAAGLATFLPPKIAANTLPPKADKAGERWDDRARDLAAEAEAQTVALQKRSLAAAEGEAALERLSVEEAGLQALMRLNVTSLDQLTGAKRALAEAAVNAAMAEERQAQATDKEERTRAALRDMDAEIASVTARAVAVRAGTKAEIDYARAEAARQAVEAVGKTLTADQVALLMQKAEALFAAQAAADSADYNRALEEELKLMRLTGRERELAERTLERKKLLQAQIVGLTEQEYERRARILALQDFDAADLARMTGEIRDGVRDAFVRGGELSLDRLGDQVEQRLREAVYDAFLAKPIDVIINATIGQLTGMTSALGGASGAGGVLASLLGKQVLGQSLGAIGGNAMIGSMAGQALGLGSGNAGLDIFASLGGAALGGMGAGALAGGGAFLASSLGMSAGASLGAGAMLGSLAGPLGALAALAVTSLAKDNEGDRPQAFSVLDVQNGRFARKDTRQGDNGPVSEINQAADAIAESLNQAAALFGVDLAKVSGLYTSVGVVSGKDSRNLGQGFYGGLIGGQQNLGGDSATSLFDRSFQAGATYTNYTDAQDLAEAVVKDTILRAIAAGASDLSAAEVAIVESASSLQEAAEKITAGRGFEKSLDDALLKLTDPAAFERKSALDAIEQSYTALKAQAEQLIAAGLVDSDVLAQLDQVRSLEIDQALKDFAAGLEGATSSTNVFADMRPRLQSWLDGVAVSAASPVNAFEQRGLAQAQYERVLEKARAQDADALGSLTSYADRLLSADANVTSNAADRIALFNKVTADIAELVGRADLQDPTVSAITQLTDVAASIPALTAAPIVDAIREIVTPAGVVASAGDAAGSASSSAAVFAAITEGLTALRTALDDGLSEVAAATEDGLASLLSVAREQSVAQRELLAENRLGGIIGRYRTATAGEGQL